MIQLILLLVGPVTNLKSYCQYFGLYPLALTDSWAVTM